MSSNNQSMSTESTHAWKKDHNLCRSSPQKLPNCPWDKNHIIKKNPVGIEPRVNDDDNNDDKCAMRRNKQMQSWNCRQKHISLSAITAIHLVHSKMLNCHLADKRWQWLKWARTHWNWEFLDLTKSSLCISGPQIYYVLAGTLVFGCRNSVLRSWILRQCRWPISHSLTNYMYYDNTCVFKFLCLFFTKHYHNWNSHLLSLFCIHGMP